MLQASCSAGDYATLNIAGVSIDSRTIQQGNLFVPIIGERFDGHDYVLEARERGAVASLWQSDHEERPHGVPLIVVDDTTAALQQLARSYLQQLDVRIIAVTGSNGKTTTKDLTASILATTYKTLKTEGNLNNHLGLPLTILKLEDDHDMAVLEMGMSERGEIELLADIAQPEAAIVTNVGESHLEQLGSRQQIAVAKLEVLHGLKRDGLLVYNGDEPLLTTLMAELGHEQLKTFRFGLAETNDYYPTAVMMGDHGCHFTCNMNGQPTYYIPMLGKHNVLNALAAIAVSKYMGVSSSDIARGLENVALSGMRVELLRGHNGVTIINDAYNASPTSMKAALELIEEMKGYNKKIVVLGDMLELGEDERVYHEEIGKVLQPNQIDYVFTYGTLAEYIASEAAHSFPIDHVFHMESKQQIVARIMQLTDERDLVLVKGSRGLQLEYVVTALVDGNTDDECGVC